MNEHAKHHQRITTITVAAVMTMLIVAPVTAKEVTLKINQCDEDGSATVKLNTSDKSWTGTNDSGAAILGTSGGNYVVAKANTFPGFAIKGTALVKKGGSAMKSEDIDTVLANFDPDESTPSGESKGFKKAMLCKWSR